jgi:hypothetical protein
VTDPVSSNYVFRGLEFESLERLHVDFGEQIRVTSVIDSERGRYSYELVCEPDWTFRVVRIESAADERALTIESDGKGEWTVDGEWRSDLDECIDIDMVATPFTNTLPIRRLGMQVDDEADLMVALVDFPSLEVTPDPQRYTRLGPTSYRFDSLDSDFTADLTVDADGFVVEYPELFERL